MCIPAHPHSVVERELPVDLPLILTIPLKQHPLRVGVRTRRRLTVSSEATNKRVRIRVACVSECRAESTDITAEVERSGPVSSRRLTIPHPLKIQTRFIVVITPSDCQVIGDGRQNIIVADLPPAIEPVNIRTVVWERPPHPVALGMVPSLLFSGNSCGAL